VSLQQFTFELNKAQTCMSTENQNPSPTSEDSQDVQSTFGDTTPETSNVTTTRGPTLRRVTASINKSLSMSNILPTTSSGDDANANPNQQPSIKQDPEPSVEHKDQGDDMEQLYEEAVLPKTTTYVQNILTMFGLAVGDDLKPAVSGAFLLIGDTMEDQANLNTPENQGAVLQTFAVWNRDNQERIREEARSTKACLQVLR